MSSKATKSALTDKKMLGRAIKDSFIKLKPSIQVKNPVMLLVYISAILTTILWAVSLFGIKDAGSGYTLAIAIILWFTVLFANFAEAIAEGRGKAQADSLRAAKRDVAANKIPSLEQRDDITVVASTDLKKGDIVIVRAGEQIPADGEVIDGAASVDESAITGESAPVIRESGGDRSAVTGGTTVLSDWIIVEVTSEAGESFLDKMIAMVEGASRKKTPNEIALQIFLVALSIIFVLVTVSLYAFSVFSADLNAQENPTSITTLVALLVCLAPTTIGALLSAIGIAGMSRLNQANVLAMSGRAIEAAGDVDILMLDKTGTITLGNRQACEFVPWINLNFFSDMPDMHCHRIICSNCFLIPDVFVNLINGKYPSLILHQQKQDIVLNGCQLHHITVYPDFLQVIVYAQTSCLVDMSILHRYCCSQPCISSKL